MAAQNAHTPGEWLNLAGTVYAMNADGTNRFNALMQGGYIRQPAQNASWEKHRAEQTPASELVANAARIVLCVNSHDAMLGALTDLEAALRKDSREKSIIGDEVEYRLDGQKMGAAINKARAAIAIARG